MELLFAFEFDIIFCVSYLGGAPSFVVPVIGVDAIEGKLELFTFGVDVIAETLIESDVALTAPGDDIDRFDLLESFASFDSFGSLGFFGPRRFGGGAFDAHPWQYHLPRGTFIIGGM